MRASTPMETISSADSTATARARGLRRAFRERPLSMIVAAVGLLTSGLLISLAGIPVVARAEAAIGRKDPGPIVLDEIAGQFLASGIVPLFAYPSPRVAAGVWIASFL